MKKLALHFEEKYVSLISKIKFKTLKEHICYEITTCLDSLQTGMNFLILFYDSRKQN